MALIITDRFPKQPREERWYPISFAEMLASLGDSARLASPIEFDTIPSDITLIDSNFEPSTGVLWIKVGGGVNRKKYLITMWIHTQTGQKLEHEVTIVVKEELS